MFRLRKKADSVSVSIDGDKIILVVKPGQNLSYGDYATLKQFFINHSISVVEKKNSFHVYVPLKFYMNNIAAIVRRKEIRDEMEKFNEDEIKILESITKGRINLDKFHRILQMIGFFDTAHTAAGFYDLINVIHVNKNAEL